VIQVFVPGTPQPQGSKQGFIRGNRVVLVEANKKLKPWRALVKEALEAANVTCQPIPAPVTLEVIFFMPKPKSVKREYPSVKPDLDKMIRSINDSATDAGVLQDDSQVIEIVAHKVYADEEMPEGVLIQYTEFLGVSQQAKTLNL
jgi:Holliday junction resolvase RusA-like endonuclease